MNEKELKPEIQVLSSTDQHLRLQQANVTDSRFHSSRASKATDQILKEKTKLLLVAELPIAEDAVTFREISRVILTSKPFTQYTHFRRLPLYEKAGPYTCKTCLLISISSLLPETGMLSSQH